MPHPRSASGSHRASPSSTRRAVIATLLSAPVVGVLARRAATRQALASAARPAALGPSTRHCALCGQGTHTMLDCPDSPRVV